MVAFKSGFCNEYSTVRWERAPGPLRKAAGLSYQEFSTLREPLGLKDDPFHAGKENKVSDWAEMLVLEGAQPLAYYDHPFFGKYPAITLNHFGTGTLTYEGTLLSDKLQESVLRQTLQAAGLAGPDQNLPESVRVKHGSNRAGKTASLLPELLEQVTDVRLSISRRHGPAYAGSCGGRAEHYVEAVGPRNRGGKVSTSRRSSN